MANKKVSQLSATTEANDGVWIIMNNSGNTETFRIKREDFLSGTSQPQLLAITGNTNSNGGEDFSTIDDVYPSQPNNITEGGTFGYFNVGFNNTINQNGVVIGRDNIKSNSGVEQGAVVVGRNNTLATDGIIFGFNNQDARGISIGKDNVGSGNNLDSMRIGHANNTSSRQKCGALGYANVINQSFVYVIGNNNNSQAQYSVLIGNNNTQTQGTATHSTILGGRLNSITSTGTHNTIVGGQNNLLSGTTSGTTLIGLIGFTSPTENDTTYVDNLKVVGQHADTYFNNLSGDTFTIDWNEGNKQKVYMTGNTTLTLTNVREGATYKLAVENGGSFDITSVSASGYTILCEGGSIPNITNSGKDLCILEVMGTDIYVRHFAGFAAP